MLYQLFKSYKLLQDFVVWHLPLLFYIHPVSAAVYDDNCHSISRSFLENDWYNFLEIIYTLKQPPMFQNLLNPFLYTYQKSTKYKGKFIS